MRRTALSWAARKSEKSGAWSSTSTRTPVERVRGSPSARHMSASQALIRSGPPHCGSEAVLRVPRLRSPMNSRVGSFAGRGNSCQFWSEHYTIVPTRTTSSLRRTNRGFSARLGAQGERSCSRGSKGRPQVQVATVDDVLNDIKASPRGARIGRLLRLRRHPHRRVLRWGALRPPNAQPRNGAEPSS